MSEFILIPLQNAPGQSAKIDAADLPLVRSETWNLQRSDRSRFGYARSTKGTPMHRLLMSPPPGLIVDHISGDTLDNRRANLRLVTQAQNTLNKAAHGKGSRFKGVSRAGKDQSYFRVTVTIERKRWRIGGIPSEEEAARVYDSLALHLHGEFARTNFPDSAAKTYEELLLEYPPQAIVRDGHRVPRKSQYKGVYLQRGRWCAQVWHEKKVQHVGYFQTELEAAQAYDEAARRLKGEQAVTNF